MEVGVEGTAIAQLLATTIDQRPKSLPKSLSVSIVPSKYLSSVNVQWEVPLESNSKATTYLVWFL